MQILNKGFITKLITINIVFVPILSMYGLNISTITLLDLSILITSIIALYYLYKNDLILNFNLNISSKVILCLILYTILNFMYNAVFTLSGQEIIDVFLRTARLIYYLIYIILVKDYFFEKSFALKIYKYIVVFATLYLIIQYFLLYFFDFSLRGYFEFLPLMRPELSEFTENLHFSTWARPRSIFGEPSQYAIFASGYLALSLFWKLKDSKKILIFITFGLLLSSSTTAILLTVLIWMFKLCISISRNINKVSKKTILLFGSILIMASLLYSQTSKFELFIGRFSSSFFNRIGGFEDYINLLTNGLDLDFFLLGFGMALGRLSNWSSGLIKILYYYGIIGFTIFIIILFKGFIKMQNKNKCFLIYLFLVGIFTELWVSNWLILFLPFLLSNQHIIDSNSVSEEGEKKCIS